MTTRMRIIDKMYRQGQQKARTWLSESPRRPALVAQMANIADRKTLGRASATTEGALAMGFRDQLNTFLYGSP